MTSKMTMSKTYLHRHIAALLTLLLLSLSACEKLEIPQKENNPENGPTEDDIIYTVNDILQQNYLQGKTADIYLEGYIVGYIPGSNMSQAVFDKGNIESNILLAATPSEEDPNCCIPVQLTTATNDCRTTRDALNLADNPSMLHQHVRIKGDIASYMGVKGILKAHNHTLLPNEEEEEPDTPDSPEDPESPDTPVIPETPTLQDTLDYVNSHGSSEETAYCVSDIKTYIPVYFEYHRSAAGMLPERLTDVYVRGYIVGCIPKGGTTIAKTLFGTTNAVESNIVIADSPNETDPNRCIAVAFSSSSAAGKATRAALNLAAHPENLHKEYIIYGDIHSSYMGSYGFKNARGFQPVE